MYKCALEPNNNQEKLFLSLNFVLKSRICTRKINTGINAILFLISVERDQYLQKIISIYLKQLYIKTG